jgi:muconolactone delta-isomerase
MEYLVTMTTNVPDGTPEESVNDVRAREAAHSRELTAQGHLAGRGRVSMVPGSWHTLSECPVSGELLRRTGPPGADGAHCRDEDWQGGEQGNSA